MAKPKVIFRNVYKEYSLYQSNKEKFIDFFIRKKETKSFFAVKDVSFEVYPGETIGVIGINGSGKSTLSNILAEVIPPTAGEIEIDGETSLIAISVGLNGQLSGYENIYLKCMMHGMSDDEIEAVKDKIIEFADIGSFIEQPVKNYSSGMKSRLGFAISVHTNPDILVIDEALSVGDQTFYDKCIRKIDEFKRMGKTIFFVSHSTAQMRKVSDRVIWMHYGEVKEFGEKNKVLNNYKEFIYWFNDLTDKEKVQYKTDMFHGQSLTDEDRKKLLNIKKELLEEEQKDRRIFKVQAIIMSFMTLLLSGFIISGVSLGTAWTQVSSAVLPEKTEEMVEGNKEIEDNKETENMLLVTEVNETGYIQVSDAILYEDVKMKGSLGDLKLFDQIEVLEQHGEQIYKIATSSNEGYVQISNINVTDAVRESNFIIDDFLPFVSEEFNNSYLYYLSFLDETVEHLEEKILGIEQEEQKDGSIAYNSYNSDVVFKSLDGKAIQQIELDSTLSMSDEFYDDIKEYSISNKGDTKYYVETENYSYVVDFVDSKLTLMKMN